jgi:hypothetical protein
MNTFEVTIAVLIGGALLAGVAMVAVLTLWAMFIVGLAYGIDFIKVVFNR